MTGAGLSPLWSCILAEHQPHDRRILPRRPLRAVAPLGSAVRQLAGDFYAGAGIELGEDVRDVGLDSAPGKK